jgi:hypothetical protein
MQRHNRQWRPDSQLHNNQHLWKACLAYFLQLFFSITDSLFKSQPFIQTM